MALLTLKGARLFPEFSIERTWNYTRLRLGQAPKHSTFKRPVATSVQPTLLKEHGDKLPSLTRRMLEVLQHLELPTDHGMDGSSILNPITRKELGNHLKNQAHARFDLSEPWVYSKNWQQHSCLQAPLSVLTDCMLSMAQKAPNNCHLLSRAVFLLPFWSLRKALHLKAALTELADPALAYMVEKLWLQQLDHTQRVPWKLIETPDQQLDGEEPDHLEFVSMEVDHPDTDYEQSESDHEPHAKRGPGVPIQPVDPVLKNTVSKLVALCINRWESLQKDLQKLILFIRDDFMGSPALYGQPMAKHAVLHQLHQAYLHAPVSDTLHLQHWRVCNDYELIHQLMCTTFKQQVRSFQKRVQSRKALLSTYLQDSAVHHQRLMLELQKLWTCGQEATGAALPVSLMRQGRLHANPKIRGQTVPLPLDHPLHCQAMLSQVKFAGQTPMGCEESHQYRRVHASSFGFLDPNHTPEDTKCGEVDYLLEHVRQSPRLNAKQHLSRLGYVHTPPDDLEPCEGFTWCWGLLAHPKVLGLTNVQQQLHSLQQLKQPYLKSSDVILLFNGLPVAYAKNRAHEVKYWAFSVRLLRQLYPKTLWSLSCYVVPPVSPHSPTVLELDVRPGRLMRPLRLVNQPNQIEWLDASELNHRHIRIGLWPHDYLQRVHSSQLTHYEYGSPDTLVLGPVLRQVPYANHTKAARLTITAKTECQRLDAPQRFLKLLYPIEDPLTRYLRDLPRSIAALAYPSKPLVYTSRQITRCHSTQMKTHTDLKVKVEVQHQERVSLRGNSLLVAVMDTGDNLEDCAVINPAAIQRGALMVEETMVLNTTVAFVQEDLSEYSKLLNRYGTEASDSFTPLPEEDQGVLKPVWSHCRTGPDPVHHLPGLIHLNKKRAIHPGDPVLTFQDGKSVLRWATTDYSVPTGATDYVLDDVDIEYVPFASGHRLMPDLDDQWVAFRQRKEGATFDEKEWRLQRQVEQRLAKQAEGAVHGAKEDVPRTSYAFRFTFTRMRQLQDGDKCTTNGQKFTIKHFFGSVEDMPWISHAQDPSFRGVQPDLIMHPSCIISRATLGFQAEGLSSTLALRDGQRRVSLSTVQTQSLTHAHIHIHIHIHIHTHTPHTYIRTHTHTHRTAPRFVQLSKSTWRRILHCLSVSTAPWPTVIQVLCYSNLWRSCSCKSECYTTFLPKSLTWPPQPTCPASKVAKPTVKPWWKP